MSFLNTSEQSETGCSSILSCLFRRTNRDDKERIDEWSLFQKSIDCLSIQVLRIELKMNVCLERSIHSKSI